MLLCLDVGNSQIFGGIFNDTHELILRFRLSSKLNSSDEFGIFLLQVIRENQIDPNLISKIAISSVVPHLDYSLRSACHRYFSVTPFFIQHDIAMNLGLAYENAAELGADRIANAIAAIAQYPYQNLIVIDFGTAITFCAIDSKHRYLGGSIFPGMRLLVESLAKNTAKLPIVEVVSVKEPVAMSTVAGIQSGIYFGILGVCKEMIEQFKQHQFLGQDVKVLATGGFSSLFEKTGIYDAHLPNLILDGIRTAALQNT